MALISYDARTAASSAWPCKYTHTHTDRQNMTADREARECISALSENTLLQDENSFKVMFAVQAFSPK